MGTTIFISLFVGLFILIISIEFISKLRFLTRHRKNLQAGQQGDFHALYELAHEYYNSNYTSFFDKNPSLATDVFNAAQKAAELIENKTIDADICDFYTLLSSMYDEGFGTTKDKKKAREYYKKALKSADKN